MAPEPSKGRQNYSEQCEALINKQVNIELCAHHQYLAIMAFYDRQEVALKGFTKLFKGFAERSRGKAEALINYQTLRGGKVVFCQISAPSAQEWHKPIAAIELVLKIEKNINEELLKMRSAAQEQGDFHLTCFLDGKMIDAQYDNIDKAARMLTNLNRVGDGLGVYVFDRELY